MSFRDIKENARRVLHDQMKVAALYIETDVATPVPVNVRVHSKAAALGEIKGTSVDYAEREDIVPHLVFLYEQVPLPKRGALVTISDTEAYRVDHALVRDGITIKAKVTRVLPADLISLPYPGSADWPLTLWSAL